MQPKCLAGPFIVFYGRDTGQIISRYNAVLCKQITRWSLRSSPRRGRNNIIQLLLPALGFQCFRSKGRYHAFPTCIDIIWIWASALSIKQMSKDITVWLAFSIYMLICLVTLLVPSPKSQEPHLALVTV